jgi:hypothetical protein
VRAALYITTKAGLPIADAELRSFKRIVTCRLLKRTSDAFAECEKRSNSNCRSQTPHQVPSLKMPFHPQYEQPFNNLSLI